MKQQLLKNGILSLWIISLGALGGTWFRTYARPQDDVSIANQFVGMWRLVSFPERLADGTVRQDPLSVAYLIYTDTGHMCFVGMNPSRPKWKSASGEHLDLGESPEITVYPDPNFS